MKQIIRLTESDLHRLVKESVRRILAETDASAAGGGALGGCNIMNGTSDETGGVAYPFGGGGKKKKVGGNPFNQSPIIRRPSPVGEPTNKKEKGIDMSDATDRTGGKNHSISMNHVNENINESWKDWAVAGMMALSPMQQANAQSNNGGIQRGTYWDLTKNQNKPNKLSKEDIRPMMKKIRAVTDNLTDYINFINTKLSQVNPQQKSETERAILNHCIKNQNTGKLVNVKNFSIDDVSYVKQVYDGGDNLMVINIGGGTYFVAVSAVNEAMMIMGLQTKTPTIVQMLKYHD